MALHSASFSPVCAFSDISGSVTTWGIYTGNTTTPWNLAHYEFDSFGASYQFYDNMSSEEYLPVVWNGSIRNEGDTSTYTIAGSTYDPSLKRYIMSESGVTNGYAYNEPSDYSNSPYWLVGETLRWGLGDSIVSNLDAGVIANEAVHLGLSLFGLIPGWGEPADAVNATWYAAEGRYIEASLSGAAAIPGAGYAASWALALRYGKASSSALMARHFALMSGTTVNLGFAAYSARNSLSEFRQENYVAGTLNAIGAVFGFAGARMYAHKFNREFEIIELRPIGTMGINPNRFEVQYRGGLRNSEHSSELGRNLALEGRPVGENQAAGHIVASSGTQRQWKAAVQSRTLLQKYGINLNDAANGIPISHPAPHNVMHTASFNNNVLSRLQAVQMRGITAGRGANAIRIAIRYELRIIGQETLKGTFR